jgi:plasmid stabilization system protein ParE
MTKVSLPVFPMICTRILTSSTADLVARTSSFFSWGTSPARNVWELHLQGAWSGADNARSGRLRPDQHGSELDSEIQYGEPHDKLWNTEDVRTSGNHQ